MFLFLFNDMLFSYSRFSWRKSLHCVSSFPSFCCGVERLMAFPVQTPWGPLVIKVWMAQVRSLHSYTL
jgi:hypothetical protein